MEDEDEVEVKDVKESSSIKEIIKSSPVYYDTLVLSGASSKAFVTLGAIQYAFDNYLFKNLTTYVGTSSGCMICYLLAIGYTPIEIMVYICSNQIMEKMNDFNIVAMIQGRGAISFSNIQEQLEKMSISKIGYLPTLNDIKEKMKKNLVCVTHNLTENRTEYLSWETHPHLPCVTAIHMSANLPLVFENYRYGNCFYVDGGISDNFAIDTGEKMGEKILGINLNNELYNFSSETDVSILEFIYNLINVPVIQAINHKIQMASDKCKIINIKGVGLNLKIFEFNITSSTKLNMFSYGYEQMKQKLE
jgi:predicted acylesterase/phospholipase RssA